MGLGYIKLGQASPSLSGGEAQRIKLAKYLVKNMLTDTIFILDEPTTGLHSSDVVKVLEIFDKLKSKGTTILVIEHNIDVIKYADWLIELGPGAGPEGGELIFTGTVENLQKSGKTKTAIAIANDSLEKITHTDRAKKEKDFIEIKNAYANNLKNISLSIPKSKITVITGVSGSGKSSLVWDVIESEAKRRFMESLSVYERYSIHEIKGSQVESIEGLGLVGSVAPDKWLYNTRSTVGTITNIYYYLAALYSKLGKRKCTSCRTEMQNHSTHWHCDTCATEIVYPKPESFYRTSYSGACTSCQGVGTIQKLNPQKVIIHPEKPLLKGAMYSPGFFPKGFLGKPGNSGFYIC
ncbi:MAG: hypothetical protein HC830_03910 [Bacteroidetes bacterium]|nr:hypothetical protein [Bacteroidota bacterium]